MAETLAKGKGRIHGIDSSAAMIKAAQADAGKAGVEKICTFEGMDTSHDCF
jgi:tRNA/tmRNA/rRNA uracil-C5-methylase (TrmA/RlmC/RlmD family)